MKDERIDCGAREEGEVLRGIDDRKKTAGSVKTKKGENGQVRGKTQVNKRICQNGGVDKKIMSHNEGCQ